MFVGIHIRRAAFFSLLSYRVRVLRGSNEQKNHVHAAIVLRSNTQVLREWKWSRCSCPGLTQKNNNQCLLVVVGRVLTA